LEWSLACCPTVQLSSRPSPSRSETGTIFTFAGLEERASGEYLVKLFFRPYGLLQRRITPGLFQIVRELPGSPQLGDRGHVLAVVELAEFLEGGGNLLWLHHLVGVKRTLPRTLVALDVCGGQDERIARAVVGGDGSKLDSRHNTLQRGYDLRGKPRVRGTELAMREI